MRFCLCLSLLFFSLVGWAQESLPLPAHSPGSIVTEIKIEGSRLEKNLLEEKIGQKKDTPLDPEQIERDIKALYSLGRLYDISVDFSDTGVLTFQLKDLPSFVDYEIKGDLSEDEKYKYLPLEDFYNFGNRSEDINLKELKDSSQTIEENLKKDGFYFSKVETEVKVITQEDPLIESGKILITYHITLGPRIEISSIKFIGNKALSEKKILEIFTTREKSEKKRFQKKSGYFSEKQLENDTLLLQSQYLEMGYNDVSIEKPQITFHDNNKVDIKISIKEGEVYKFGKIQLEDSSLSKTKLSIKENSNYKKSMIANDVDKLNNAAYNLGYARAIIIPEIDIDQKTKLVNIKYKVDLGQKFYIGKIIITGNKKTSEKFIKSQMKIQEGDTFSQEQIDKSKQALLDLEIFSKIRIVPVSTSRPDTLDLQVDLSDSEVLGGSALMTPALDTPSWLWTTMELHNPIGRGEVITVDYRLFSKEQRASVDIQKTLQRLNTYGEVLFESKEHPLQSYYEIGARVGLFKRLTPTLRTSLGYGFSLLHQRQDHIQDEALNDLGRRGLVEASVAFDNRNLQEDFGGFTSRGWYLSGKAELASKALGSSVDFQRFSVRAARFFSLSKGSAPSAAHPSGVTLKIFGRADWILAQAGQEIPYSERYQLGGIGSVRGFEQFSLNSFAQVGGQELPIGGTQALSGTIEVEAPFARQPNDFAWQHLRWVAFLDAGRLFDPSTTLTFLPEQKDFGVLPMRTSIGVGARWYMPLADAPMRLELARPLDAGFNEGFVLHFSIATQL